MLLYNWLLGGAKATDPGPRSSTTALKSSDAIKIEDDSKNLAGNNQERKFFHEFDFRLSFILNLVGKGMLSPSTSGGTRILYTL